MSQASSVVCVGFQTEMLVSQMCEEFDVRWKIMSKAVSLTQRLETLLCVCVFVCTCLYLKQVCFMCVNLG